MVHAIRQFNRVKKQSITLQGKVGQGVSAEGTLGRLEREGGNHASEIQREGRTKAFRKEWDWQVH